MRHRESSRIASLGRRVTLERLPSAGTLDAPLDQMSSTKQLRELGQSVWLDFLEHRFVTSGELDRMIEECLAEGININITLLFSVSRYATVVEAYLRALERRIERGQSIHELASVASFFVSRVDAKVDQLLDAIIRLGGPAADYALCQR